MFQYCNVVTSYEKEISLLKIIRVLDTSVCVSNYESLKSFEKDDIIIPFKVLEELDNLKDRQDSIGFNARQVIRILDSLRETGSLQLGVSLGKGLGKLKIQSSTNSDLQIPDREIIGVAQQLQKEEKRKVILVSKDINMRVTSDALGIRCEDYTKDQIISSCDKLYSGNAKIVTSEGDITKVYKDGFLSISHNALFYNNQFVLLTSELDEKHTAPVRVVEINKEIIKVKLLKNMNVNSIRCRNVEQMFAVDLLLDPKIGIITLTGKSGTGKTLLATAAGLEQTRPDSKISRYKKFIISKPVQPVGRDIGYLPGSMEEKMMPWLKPVTDNLQYIIGDKDIAEDYIENGIIEIEALTYIRGRSIPNAFILIEEVQNMNLKEIKAVLTRVGEGSKIVMTGDIEQIDSSYLDETSNALTHVVERFKSYDLSGHVTLQKGERSAIATIASNIL